METLRGQCRPGAKSTRDHENYSLLSSKIGVILPVYLQGKTSRAEEVLRSNYKDKQVTEQQGIIVENPGVMHC